MGISLKYSNFVWIVNKTFTYPQEDLENKIKIPELLNKLLFLIQGATAWLARTVFDSLGVIISNIRIFQIQGPQPRKK